MAVSKVLLYYAFTPLADPDAIRLWQRDLCESLGLRGRILISKHGINGTVGGELGAVKKYLRKTRDYPAFKHLDVKWSEGSGLDSSQSYPQAPHGVSLDFPRLVVKVRDEIVSFGAPDELQVDETGVRGGGTKLTPAQLHELVAEGGIVRYGETFGDSGLWNGSLYVFDNRVSIDFTPDAAVIGQCHRCGASTNRMQNCNEVSCRTQLVVCADCAALAAPECPEHAGMIAG